MSNIRALLSERLRSGIWHPGDEAKGQKPTLLVIPGLRSTGIPPEMAEHFANEAGLPSNDAAELWAEAIATLIETDHEIVPKIEMARLRAEAATLEDAQTGQSVDVVCRCNRAEPLLSLTLGRAMVVTNGARLKKRVDEVCRCT